MTADDPVGRARHAVDTAVARGRTWTGKSDVRLLLVFALAMYGLFTLVAVVLGLDLNGTVDTLRRITFLSALYAMLVLALNLQWGYAGLFNIGVAGFMAVGVYTMGMLTTAPSSTPPGLGLPLPVGIAGGIVAAALVGTVAALPALRLRGDYLAIVTLAVSEIIRLTYRSPVFQDAIGPLPVGTGGSRGMSLPDNPIRIVFYENPGQVTSDPNWFGALLFDTFGAPGIESSVLAGWAYALGFVLLVAGVYWLLRRVGNSPFGRVLKAIREDELVATSLGKDTRWFKIKVFALGCGIMGLAAMLWRLPGGYTSPGDFMPITTFYVFVALIIGGAGSNTGSVLGGAVFASLLFEGPNFVKRIVTQLIEVGQAPQTLFQALGELLAFDPSPLLAYVLSDVNVAALRLVLLGVVLVYIIQRRPQGLLGHRKEVASSVDLSVGGEGGDRK
jgi:branched-chain amino acid transport system permease protein